MLPILIACLLGGVVFAALAVILTRSKGNTIADALKAMKDGAPESLKLEIGALQKQFKLSTQIPVVALYAISALVALGVPSLMILRQDSPAAGKPCEEGEITLTGKIKKSAEGNVYLVPTDLRIEPSGFFRIPLKKSESKRDYNIESESYLPVTLNVDYVKKDHKLYVNWDNATRDTLRVDTSRNTAELSKPIELPPRAATVVVNSVTPSPEPLPAPVGPQDLEAFE